MDLHQVQLHDIDSEGNEILMSPKNRAKDVTVTDMDENYNFGDSYLKNDTTLSDDLSIINKLITTSLHVTDGNEDGVGFVKVATIIPRSSFSKIGYLYFDVIANNSKSKLEICFEKDAVNAVNLSYFRYDESPINAKIVYDSRIRTFALYIEKTIELSSIYVLGFKSTVPSDMINLRWENSMYEGGGIVGATAQIIPHSAYIKEGKTAPETTDCFWNDTNTTPSVMKYWDGEKWTQFSTGAGGGTSVTVDDVMSDTSINPVQNKILKKYIDERTFDVDNTMSDTSKNPVQNKVIKEYIDKKSSTIDDDNISKETVWSSKKIHDLGWTGTMEEYEKDKDNIPDGATVNITDDYDEDSDGASIDDGTTSKTKTWSSDKISKMIWTGTLAEYELAKDTIPEGTVINIEDDYDDEAGGANINDAIESESSTWSSKKIKGLMWNGTSEEYEKEKDTIPEGALVNITDDYNEDTSASIDDTATSKTTTWSSDKIKGLTWSGTLEEYERDKDTIPDGATVNITDDYDDTSVANIDDENTSKDTTWSSDKIKGLTWTGTLAEYELAKDSIPEGATVNITDDYDEDSGAGIDDVVESESSTWSSKKIKGLSWSGTMEEYEANKDSIPEGATVNITDDYDEIIDDDTESDTTTWSSKKIQTLTWSGTLEEYERDKDSIPDGATVNIVNDEIDDSVKKIDIKDASLDINENKSEYRTINNSIGQLLVNITVTSLSANKEYDLFTLQNTNLYSEISKYIFTKNKKFINIVITTSGVVKVIPMEDVDYDDVISENFVFLFETRI